ncbi:hypothetical protein GOODEAATRI_012441, partial [Goodea atripinnis]
WTSQEFHPGVRIGSSQRNRKTSKRDFQLADVVRLMSRNPAYLSSLGHLKGSLAPGFDADLVIWDPETGFQGVVCATIVRGQLVYKDGNFCSEPLGKHLLISQKTNQAQL